MPKKKKKTEGYMEKITEANPSGGTSFLKSEGIQSALKIFSCSCGKNILLLTK